MAQMRPGDWSCPACSNHNFANRTACNKCATPKGGGLAAPGNLAPMKAKAGKGQRASPYASPTPLNNSANGMRPGDWCCPQCGNHNYANRTACGKCNVAKAGLGIQNMMPNMMQMQNPMPMHSGAQAQVNRPGDWKCFACSNVNYANRDACNRCQMSKDVFVAKTGLRAGDWICAACTNHNYASKTECNKCGAVKGPENVHMEGKAEKMRPGDWICASCSNHNYANKQACNKCSSAKPGPTSRMAGGVVMPTWE